jgi:hypothetical protein
MQRGLVLAAAGVAAVVLAATASGGERIDAAVAALQDDPVYVAPGAELAISDADQTRLRETIDSAGAGPVYIAILPSAAENETGGDPDGVLQQLHDGLDRPGTYAAVVGKHFRAGSEGVLPPGVAGQLATEALNANRGQGVTVTLIDFVHRVAAAQQSGATVPPGNGQPGDEPTTGGGALIGLLILGGGGFVAYRTIRRRRQTQAQLAEVKTAAHEDLIALADDVQKLEQPVEQNPDAKREYEEALDDYDDASRAYDRATKPKELEAVASSLEEGRYHMAVAEAVLAGKQPPERRAPCFFDPRHGPSTRDVEWAPPGGAARTVPACEADALAVEEGRQPMSREVVVGGQRVPYWNAPPYFGPWAGGYFMPFGGMGFLSGLFVGELLGGAFGGWGYGSGAAGGFGGWSDGGGGGGDFGGGMDFGGGDFGGGGGGGGDF